MNGYIVVWEDQDLMRRAVVQPTLYATSEEASKTAHAIASGLETVAEVHEISDGGSMIADKF